MARKSKKETLNRTKIVKIRLTQAERDLMEKKAAESTDGNLSEYIRTLLLNKKIPVEVYDTTAENANIAINNFTKHIRKIGINYNQIARFIQAKYSSEEAKMLLGKGNKLMGEVRDYTVAIYKILAKIERYYDSKNQQK